MFHIVLFKFDEAKLAAEFPGDSLQETFLHLRKVVPGLQELNMNAKDAAPWPGYVDCSQGYTHALVSRHVDAEALHTYADHPDHKALLARFSKCFAAPPLRMEVPILPPIQTKL